MSWLGDMFGGSSKQQTQSTTVDPYSKSKPLINKALADALKAYKGGYGNNVYTGSTVIPYSQQTTQAMNRLGALAKSQDNSKGIVGLSKDIIGNGGFNNHQLSALKNMQKDANAKFSYSPEFENVLGSSMQDAREGLNANASAAGRYGSGVAQGVMTKELGNLSSQARLGEYQNWQDRKTAATNSLFNAGQTGHGNMATAYQNAQLPYQTLMSLGGMNEDLAGRLKNDELRIFDAKNQSPWDQIGRLMQVANLGGAYNTSNTTSQSPGQNPFLSALGLGLGGLSFLGG